MAPHLTAAELDFIFTEERKGRSPKELHTLLQKRRSKQNMSAPCLMRFRQALRGKTYRRSPKETRGRKRKLDRKWVQKLNTTRKTLLKRTSSEREVRWEDIRRACRAPKVHRTTLLRSFQCEGLKVQARPPREKPDRTPAQAKARMDYCQEWCTKTVSFFTSTVDMIIDNKRFDIPTTERARKYLEKQRVRFHLRTPGEGSLPHMTKPGRKKNRLNVGAHANVCAGICGGRIALWEYLPKRWNADEAASLYQNHIIKTLQKHRGMKRKYLLFEDNDPVGYKSNLGKKTKVELNIEAVPMPAYSPDLNPLDYTLWEEILGRMQNNTPKNIESVAAYKKRLRLTALRLPSRVVTKAVGAMPKRMASIVAARGYSIKDD